MLSSPVYAKLQHRRATSHARLTFFSFSPSQPSNLQMRFLHPGCFCGTLQHSNAPFASRTQLRVALSASRTHLRDNVQTPSKARHHKALLHRQHRAPLSPLAATLTDHPASVANKRLTVNLTPLDATLTKNRGEGQVSPFEPFNLQTFQPANGSVPNSLPHTFLANPQQLTPCLSHSYKNHRGAPSVFPSLLARSLPKECFTTLLPSIASTLFLKTAGVYGGTICFPDPPMRILLPRVPPA
jgi:hypothetical protein